MKEIEKERQMIREIAQKTALRTVQPRAAEIDAKGEFPWDLVESFGKQGLLSIFLPESYGGMDGDLTSFCIVIEEIAKVCGSSSLIILAQGMGTLPILLSGNPSQKDLYLRAITERNSLIALAFNEPESELGILPIKTRVERKGSNYLIHGRKRFITHGGLAKFYIVMALTQNELESEGLSVFVVEDGADGLFFGEREKTIGMRGMVITDVIFKNCRVSQEALLGNFGEGGKIVEETLNRTRPAIGAQAVGIAQGALDFAIHYANERIQFGKPISSFQAIQFMIADMATLVEAARSLVYKAVDYIDANDEHSEYLSTISKTFASQIAMKVTTDAVQILGGYGYMKDYPVERMMRDAKVTQIYEGVNQVHRWKIAELLFSKR